MTVGETIREARLKRGLSQSHVAAILNIRQSAVAQWESNKTAVCRKHQKPLADLLGIPAEKLVEVRTQKW